MMHKNKPYISSPPRLHRHPPPTFPTSPFPAALPATTGEVRFVLGCISQLREGEFFLEDTSGEVRIDVTEAAATGGFFTESCVVVAEGIMRADGIFHVRALGFPPAERKEVSLSAAHGLNFFGGHPLTEAQRAAQLQALTQSNPEERMVVFADVWLDRPEVLERIKARLAGACGEGGVCLCALVLLLLFISWMFMGKPCFVRKDGRFPFEIHTFGSR